MEVDVIYGHVGRMGGRAEIEMCFVLFFFFCFFVFRKRK